MLCLMPLMAWYWIRQVKEQPMEPLHPEHANARVWDLLKEPLMRRLLLVNWLLSSCWDVHTFVVPVLGHERGYSASVIGTILGAFAIAAAAVRVLMPLLAQHLKEWLVVTAAMVATALLFAVYPFMVSAWSMGLCSVLLGLTGGLQNPFCLLLVAPVTVGADAIE